MNQTTTILTTTQVTMPIRATTVGADGTKMDFLEIRRKYNCRPVNGLPLPSRKSNKIRN
jgi:hypothetical protein